MSFLNNYLSKDGFVSYYEFFFKKSESDDYYISLLNDVDWRQRPIIIFGKEIMQPRLTALFSDEGIDYKYSGVRMTSYAWIPVLLEIKNRVETFSKCKFNSALLNLYRDGNDSMGWHRDNEKELGNNPNIASVSFGAERTFCLRHLADKTNKVAISLSHGSLLLMSGETQHNWYHCVSKTKKIALPRINITFRNILS